MFAIHEELRKDFPQTGCVIQAYLFRTEDDARRLAAAGSRVRLVKGAYKEPAARRLPGQGRDRQGVRPLLKILMEGEGYPMIGSHDPRLIAIAQELARTRRAQAGRVRVPDALRHPRATSSGGSRPRATGCGSTSPYGTDWYGYFMRRLAEKPGQPAASSCARILTKG